ncbi:MAG: hypothetical protein GAK30_01980 [Paracidovorax wautersii]|uniref:Uncharacterized protein n=1 Tax=Paracidovorax wautersii TaxID=1177982 RepID=A0A7V8FNV4_9BURK|nr:MAG: hypothetical protein GAK30_01980 [Paracidovorax wautersii]
MPRIHTLIMPCALAAGLALGALPPALAQTQAPANAAAAAADAPAVDLRVTHYTRSIGQDGVQRETTYSNHVYRRSCQVWIERELPPAIVASLAHGHEHAHGPHAGHAHDEAQGAPLLLQRNAQGQVSVKVVLAEARRVIEVDLAHYGNVGYGGSWDGAYWIVTPVALRAMTPEGPLRAGVQRYTRTQGEQTTRVDWDVAGQYPRRIEQVDAHGTSLYRLTATRLPGGRQPWTAIADYSRGDYSDLLD